MSPRNRHAAAVSASAKEDAPQAAPLIEANPAPTPVRGWAKPSRGGQAGFAFGGVTISPRLYEAHFAKAKSEMDKLFSEVVVQAFPSRATHHRHRAEFAVEVSSTANPAASPPSDASPTASPTSSGKTSPTSSATTSPTSSPTANPADSPSANPTGSPSANCAGVLPPAHTLPGPGAAQFAGDGGSGRGLRLYHWDAGHGVKRYIDVDALPVYSLSIDAALRALALLPLACLEGLKNVQFHSTLSKELLVTLVYQTPRDADDWCPNAIAWRDDHLRASPEITRCTVVARWWKHHCIVGEPYVTEVFRLSNGELPLVQPWGHFSNPNAELEEATLEWMRERAAHIAARDTCLELCCGNGNNLAALGDLFGAVEGVENNRALAAAAEENLTRLKIFHKIYRCDMRNFHGRGPWSLVVVDPPRAGVPLETLEFLSRAACTELLWISCNPEALRRNLDALRARRSSWSVAAVAFFDHFPYTEHREVVAHLRRSTICSIPP